MQTFTSAETSINKNRLPAVYNKVSFSFGDVVLDYGCGKYTDHIKNSLPDGVRYLPIDPYNKTEEENKNSAGWLYMLTLFNRCPVTVICSNVLNVIDDVETIKAIANKLTDIVKRTSGRLFVTVYEGDKSGNGKQTKKDCYQRNEKLSDYLRFFPGAIIKNGMITL